MTAANVYCPCILLESSWCFVGVTFYKSLQSPSLVLVDLGKLLYNWKTVGMALNVIQNEHSNTTLMLLNSCQTLTNKQIIIFISYLFNYKCQLSKLYHGVTKVLLYSLMRLVSIMNREQKSFSTLGHLLCFATSRRLLLYFEGVSQYSNSLRDQKSVD